MIDLQGFMLLPFALCGKLAAVAILGMAFLPQYFHCCGAGKMSYLLIILVFQ
jgi:hypothetical protein